MLFPIHYQIHILNVKTCGKNKIYLKSMLLFQNTLKSRKFRNDIHSSFLDRTPTKFGNVLIT